MCSCVVASAFVIALLHEPETADDDDRDERADDDERKQRRRPAARARQDESTSADDRESPRAAGSRLEPGTKTWPAPTNLKRTSPSSMTSPASMMLRLSSTALTRTPFDEPLSTIS